ncbi:crossover junction endodeoxyribonuclease RuvC, partial [bacterium]|nr:crossover junction endodeoxyribonuclease RuvC [bacterium]
MRILGIDPGIATTGYGVIEKLGNKFKVEEYGVITTPAHTPLPRRLAQLATDLRQLIDRTSPQSCAV